MPVSHVLAFRKIEANRIPLADHNAMIVARIEIMKLSLAQEG